MGTVDIRGYQPADAQLLSDLYVHSVLHYGPRAYNPRQVAAWAASASPEKFAERCMDGRLVLLAEDRTGSLLGFGDLEPGGHLDFLYTAPEAEGRHVGSLICDALEAHAQENRIARIYVEASALARPLFERRGFVLVGRNDFLLGDVAIYNFSMEKRLQITNY